MALIPPEFKVGTIFKFKKGITGSILKVIEIDPDRLKFKDECIEGPARTNTINYNVIYKGAISSTYPSTLNSLGYEIINPRIKRNIEWL